MTTALIETTETNQKTYIGSSINNKPIESIPEVTPEIAQRVMTTLNLKLTATISGGRYICRITNTQNSLVSFASCKTLQEAVTRSVREAQLKLVK